jgi:acetyl esterase/lipase
MARSFLMCLAAMLLAGCQSVYFAAINAGARPQRDVAYGELPAQRLDVYAPDGASGAPVVVFVYGGRWQRGTRAQYAFVGEALSRRGIVTMVIDYRHGEDGGFPAFVADVASAVRWARDHATEFGGDPARLHLAGHSAGAHIAALVATDARYLKVHGMAPRDLAGVIGMAGPYDFAPITDADLQRIFGRTPEEWAASQPIGFVDGDEPPFLLLHGDNDKSVWPRNSERLAAKLRAAGVAVDYRVYPGVGHVRILSALRFPSLAPTLNDTASYVLR